jgi:serine/threonine protein kinase
LEIDPKSIASDITSLARKPAHVNSDEEANYLSNLLAENPAVAERLKNYAEPKVVGVGGSGIILRGTYTPNGGYRAIKFPRKRQYSDVDKDPNVIEIDPERQALEKVSHQNITRLYDAFELPNGASYCMITEFVPGDDTLDTYAQKLICNMECQKSEERLAEALKKLGVIVCNIASALRYLHNDARLLHFDIKPENILISPSGVPFVSDLGFARDIEGHRPDDLVEVGFTWKYAHPRLQDPHRGALVTNVPQKAKTPLRGNELGPKFDVFAFGRTLQEILGLIYIQYGERIHSTYIFDYLHVVASLCLDGRNGSTASPSKPGEFMPDNALGMSLNVYAHSPLATFDDVLTCLERLIGVRRFEDELPEVDRWYGSTIKVTETGSTTLTPRVASILGHPVLQRLQNERQLGMLDSIFPTATHTRFQHTLGTYHAATLYLASLYYDPETHCFER